jgi:hypothetical protein
MGIWRRPCAGMMILFAMRVRDAGQKEREREARPGESQSLLPTQGKWSSTTLDRPQQR